MKWLPWGLFALVVVVSFLGWADLRDWQFDSLTALALFPLLGLLAWSIMWTHYAVGGVRLFSPAPENKLYSKITSIIVLVCLLLHPGLLAWSQWDTTGILPAESYYNYVGPSLRGVVILGSVSLVIFLSFEVFELLRKHPLVKRNWKWISLSQMIAMILIFIHALRLGQNLQSGWFQLWWIALGVLLVPCFGLIIRNEWSQKSPDK